MDSIIDSVIDTVVSKIEDHERILDDDATVIEDDDATIVDLDEVEIMEVKLIERATELDSGNCSEEEEVTSQTFEVEKLLNAKNTQWYHLLIGEV